jgi:hypothetical protein
MRLTACSIETAANCAGARRIPALLEGLAGGFDVRGADVTDELRMSAGKR